MEFRFTWDPKKARANLTKHRVSFEEASSVFADPLSRIVDDPRHSVGEHREVIVGRSDQGRLLVVMFTEREDFLRIFSSRSATRAERRHYEEARP